MIKNYLLFTLLIATCQIFSQEVYLNSGKNFTAYRYKTPLGQSNSTLQSGTGSFYEIGLTKPIMYKNLFYSFGLSLNEYNAIGGNSANSYRWDTRYLGIQGGLSYSFFPHNLKSKDNLDFLIGIRLNTSTIIYGKQEVDGVYYDLINQREFSGILLEPAIGFKLKYHIPSFGALSIGYSFGKSFNISNTTEEKLSFNTNQIGLGFHFTIKQNKL
jgi:hypothetical protein